jgi:hypothetical protein
MSETEVPIGEVLTRDDWGVQTVLNETTDGDILIETRHDVEPILEANKADYNSGNTGKTKLGWGRKVADIPLGVYLKWRELYGIDVLNKNHAEGVRRLLNSNEWRYLRTAPGQLAR